MIFYFRAFVILIAFLAITARSYLILNEVPVPIVSDETQLAETMYLPNGKALSVLALGYKNVVSNLLWFKTISYFGKHYRSDQNYCWLAHMADVVTSLDHNSTHVFEFVSTILSWEAGKPQDAIVLLTKAIQYHPENWKFYYLRGFTYMFFLKQNDKARDDFVSASKLPDAHPLVTRLAATTVAQQDSPEAAVDFLRGALLTIKDSNARNALEEKLREAYLDIDIKNLQTAAQIFKSQQKRSPAELKELVDAGIIKSLPPDPFGGSYYLDLRTGEVRTTSKHKGISRLMEERDTEHGRY